MRYSRLMTAIALVGMLFYGTVLQDSSRITRRESAIGIGSSKQRIVKYIDERGFRNDTYIDLVWGEKKKDELDYFCNAFRCGKPTSEDEERFREVLRSHRSQ